MRDIDIVDDMDDKPQRVKKSGGFLGKLIAVLLGLIIGILAGAGGIVGIGYLLVFNTDIKTNMGTINSLAGTNINFADFLDEKYGNETFVTLIGDTVSTLGDISNGNGTLQNLNAISPLVGKLISGEDGQSGLVKTLNDYYLNVTAEDIMNKALVKPNGAEKDPNKYLMDYLMQHVNDVPVADFLIKMGYPLNDTLLAICCGVENVDWEKNADGTIQMLNGKTQLTLGQFLSEDLEQAIFRLPIDAIMPISLSDRVMLMLAYGEEFAYHTEVKNGKTVVVMNQVFYTYDKAKGKLFDARGTEIASHTISNANFAQGTCQVQVDTDTTHYLKAEDVTEERYVLYAYSDANCENAIFYEKTTLKDLDKGAVHLVEDMYIKDVLDIDAQSDKMLISLAYGVKDIDYVIVQENGVDKIQSINPPRTIKDLRDCGEDLIYEIYLSDVIDAEANENVTMYILYGKEHLHYEVEIDGSIRMLQKQVAVIGNEVYNEYGDVKIGALNNNTFTENNVVYTLGNATGKTVTLSNGNVATLHYVVDANGDEVKFNRITLGDLKGNSPILQHITTRLTLSDVLGATALEGHTVLGKLKDVYIADLANTISNMTVGDVYGSDNVLLQAVKDTKLEELGDTIDTLTVGHLFGDRDPVTDQYITDSNGNIVISSNPILNALSSTTIIHLEDRAKALTIAELIPGAENNQILKHLLTSTFLTLSDDVTNLKFADVFGDNLWEKYDANKAGANYKEGTGDNAGFAVDADDKRIMKPVWKYMLFDNVTTVTPQTTIPDYYIVSLSGRKCIDDMMKNMTKNMQNTPISYLVEDGLISFTTEDAKNNFLKAYVVTTVNSATVKTYLKDMTVIDILNYIANTSPKD